MKKSISLFIVFAFVLSLYPSFVLAKASKKQISGHLNLNTASAEDLDKLPGLSPKKAEAIVDYRKEHPFKSVDDLDNIKGFSPKSIAKIKNYVSTEGNNNLSVEGGNKSKSKKSKSEASAKKQKTKKEASAKKEKKNKKADKA